MHLPFRLLARQSLELSEKKIAKYASKFPVFSIGKVVTNILSVKKQMSLADWVKLHTVIPLPGFGYQVFRVLLTQDCGLSEIRKFISALQERKILNPILKAQLLPAFDVYHKDCTELDHKFIIDSFDEVVSQFPVLTSDVANLLLRGISVTPVWKEKGKIVLSVLKDKVDDAILSSAARAAFLHNDPQYGWELMEKAIICGKNFDPKLYGSILDHHERIPGDNSLFKLLDFVKEHSYMLPASAADKVSTVLEKEPNFVSRFAEINDRGYCSCCNRKLQKLPLTSVQHAKLLDKIEETFDIDHEFNSYEKEEILHFKRFLKMCPPYTIVLDGANIFYRLRDNQLWSVMRQLEKRQHKILVICRQHMVRHKAFLSVFKGHLSYVVKNRTKDDTFTIYAALASGPNTLVLSNDYFGTYYTKVRGDTRVLFRRWQLSNQVVGTGFCTKELIFPTFSPFCQSLDDGSSLHVPLVSDENCDAFAPSGWLCIQKVSKAQKKNATKLWPVRLLKLQDQQGVDAFRMHGRQLQSKEVKKKEVKKKEASDSLWYLHEISG